METNSIVVDCGQCRGAGTTILDGKSIQCPGCKGSGKIRVNEPATVCGQCRGAGKIILDGGKIQCPGCSGSGYFMG